LSRRTATVPVGRDKNEQGPTRWASFRPLRHRQFALVWSAALVSNIGSWMQTIAVGALVTQLTGHASAAGFVAAAAFVPIGVLSPIGGALADRLDRRRFLLLTTVGETAFATLLAALYATGHTSTATVSAAVFGGGCMAALGFPCYQAMLPDLVGKDDLLGAVSLSTAQFNLGRVVGPALAGLVIHFGSYGLAFAVNAVSFGAVMIALAIVRVPSPRLGGEVTLWSRIREGAAAAWADPGCRAVLGLATAMALCASPFIALIPAMAFLVFHGGAATVSLLVTAQGIGAVAGALLLAPLAERFGRRRMLLVNLVLLPIALVLYSASPSPDAGAVALALVGLTYVSVFSGLNVVLQLRAPAELRGRILSLFFVVVGVIYPLGASLQGKLADHAGLREVTAGGAIAMLAVFAAAAALRPAQLRMLDQPLPGEPGQLGRPLQGEQVAGAGHVDQPG
jgi:MFS family permease